MNMGIAPGPSQTRWAFGVQYMSPRIVWLPQGSTPIHFQSINDFGVSAALCQLRLFIAGGDECLAERMDGELTNKGVTFYVHPSAETSIHGLMNAVNLKIGGKQSSYTNYVIPPAERRVAPPEIREAVDLTLREEGFEGLADLVVELRPRT